MRSVFKPKPQRLIPFGERPVPMLWSVLGLALFFALGCIAALFIAQALPVPGR